MTGELLLALARANVAAAATILVVLTVRPLLQRTLGPRAFYRLWLAPPLCAAATLLPYPAEAGWSPVVIAWGSALSSGPATAARADTGWSALLLTLWALGAVTFAAVLATRQARYVRRLGELRPATVQDRRVLRASTPGVGPAIVGAAIVLPADFETQFTAEEQEAILSHEAAHLARGDVAANAFVAAARTVCWFNPLVHLAAFVCRLDQELACDAAVSRRAPASAGSMPRRC